MFGNFTSLFIRGVYNVGLDYCGAFNYVVPFSLCVCVCVRVCVYFEHTVQRNQCIYSYMY